MRTVSRDLEEEERDLEEEAGEEMTLT